MRLTVGSAVCVLTNPLQPLVMPLLFFFIFEFPLFSDYSEFILFCLFLQSVPLFRSISGTNFAITRKISKISLTYILRNYFCLTMQFFIDKISIVAGSELPATMLILSTRVHLSNNIF